MVLSPFEDPTWIAGVDKNENFDSDEDDSDRNNDSDEGDDSDDESTDNKYKGSDFEPDIVEEKDEDDEEEEVQDSNLPDEAQPNPTEMEAINNDTVDEPCVNDPDPVDDEVIDVQPSEDKKPPTVELRRSTHERKEPVRYGFKNLQHCHNIVTIDNAIEYDPLIAGVAAHFIHEVNEVALMNGHQFEQQ